MRIGPLAHVKARLNAYAVHVETEGPVVITRNGKPVALLLALRNAEDLDRLVLAHSPRFQRPLHQSRPTIRVSKALTYMPPEKNPYILHARLTSPSPLSAAEHTSQHCIHRDNQRPQSFRSLMHTPL